jgi:endonuclease/exonuclease/phosphatase family metal-dependent hydrolase
LSPRIVTGTTGGLHTPRVSFDPLAPYGPVIESTVRVVTWNVWGRFGADWAAREALLESALGAAAPDLVCLTESWRQGEVTQAGLVAGRLGLGHHCFTGDWEQDGWVSGVGLVSRWPMSEPERRPLRGPDGAGAGEAVHVSVAGERGTIQLFTVMLDYPLGASGIRQGQVRQLVEFVAETAPRRDLVVVCGDFNAGPDSDEIRMLTGRSAPPVPGMVFYDAWELAGDGSPGFTWFNRNPLAALGLFPDRRFDYILSAWPRRGGAGHPVRCSLLGVRLAGEQQISDHYGVVADLRY